MAAPLPAIHNTRGHSPAIHDQAIAQHRVPSPPNKYRPPDQYLKPQMKVSGRREREHMMKQHLLKNKQPSLTKMDTHRLVLQRNLNLYHQLSSRQGLPPLSKVMFAIVLCINEVTFAKNTHLSHIHSTTLAIVSSSTFYIALVVV